MTDENTAQEALRCGFVALIGAPNAGKSTLLNRMVGGKVAIVTHKVQTTRSRIRGIALHENTQLVFVDTPGIFTPRRRLDRAMVSAAWTGAADADLIVLLVDCQGGVSADVKRIITGLTKERRKAVLALNKIDLLRREQLLALTQELNEMFEFEQTFMISAEKGHGVEDLRAYLAGRLPTGPWLYPEDQMADVPLRSLASEITREKLYLRLHQELPYSLTVETESWKDKKDGSARVEQVIYVQRDGHKKILIGKNGEGIKTIGKLAREEMQDEFGMKIHLFLFVKVREKWGDDPERYEMMGLEFPKDK
ncbi:MAG: GTPase Era [Rhodobiaceae bacterium]|nr:GTPase Era [Rhodobiaceae bacterium]